MAYNLKDPEEVKEYITNLGIEYRFSCYHENRPSGCHLLGDYLEAISKDFKTAAKVYKRNCDLNNYGHSCFKYGSYVYRGKGDSQDFKQAIQYFTRGCDLDYPKSCLLSGMTIGKHENDYVKSLKHLEKGCKGDIAESCHNATSYYIKGKPGVEVDMKKAFDFALKGCELRNMYACSNVSQMYSNGEGTSKNHELALKYKQIAIELYNEISEQSRQIKFGETE